MAFQGLADAPWFWDKHEQASFPNDMLLLSAILAGAWLALRFGRRVVPARIDHWPSFWLLGGSTAAGVVAMLVACDQISTASFVRPPHSLRLHG